MIKKVKRKTTWVHSFDEMIAENKWLAYVWLAGVTFLVYHQVLGHDFVNFDDSKLIYNNPIVTQPELAIKEIFTWGLFGGYYKPLAFLSWRIDYQLFGANPTVFHFNNLLLHFFNVVLVYRIGVALMGQFNLDKNKIQLGAILLATLFAVHPLHVESVAWAVERKDVLFSFFFLAGWLVYLQYLKNGKSLLLVAVALLYLASMLSKSMGITLLPVLLLTDYVYGRTDIKKIVLEKIPIAVSLLLGAYLFGLIGNLLEFSAPLAMAGESTESVTNLEVSFFEKIQIQSSKYLLWLLHLIFPVKLSVVYPGEQIIKSLGPIKLLAPFLLAGICWLTYSLRRNRKELLFGLLFFLVTLAPILAMSLKKGFGVFLSDRYTYIPMLGLFLLLLPTILKLPIINNRKAAITILCVPIFLLSIGSFQAVKVWGNSATLWTNVIEKVGNSWVAYSGRGMYYLDRGEYEAALFDFDKAILYSQGLPSPFYSRARLMIETEDFEEALVSINRYLELKPNNATALKKRSYIHTKLQRMELAMEDINKAINLKPNEASQYVDKADILIKTKRLEEALKNIDKSIELSPDYWLAYQKRALIREMRDDINGALQDIERSIAIKPDEPLLFNNKSVLLFKLGRLDEALSAVNQCLVLDPYYVKGIATQNTILAAKKNGGTPPTIGLSQPSSDLNKDYLMYKQQATELKQEKQTAEAVEVYTKLISIAPDNYSNYVERGLLNLELGNNELAVADFTVGIQLKPDYYQILFFRSIAYNNGQQTSKAMQDAKAAQAHGVEITEDYLRALEAGILKEQN
ncbi:MAG: tetratricopeptide (TPR) repeat protein [Neolewinella sp.]|jgi:tetratricopeptide (TPR) repeat protein